MKAHHFKFLSVSGKFYGPHSNAKDLVRRFSNGNHAEGDIARWNQFHPTSTRDRLLSCLAEFEQRQEVQNVYGGSKQTCLLLDE